jgi:hypothetical protein
MVIPESPVSGPTLVPEDPKQYVVTIAVIVSAETTLAAADRVADLGRRLTEDCEIAGWRLQDVDEKGGAHVQ